MGTTMTINNTLRGVLFGLAFAAAACASDDGGGGGDDDGGEPIPENMLLDDLDDDDAAIHEVEGRIGAWFSYNDGTSDSQQPSPNGVFTPSPGGAAGTDFYAGSKGDSYSEWGAGFGFDINNTGVDGPSGEGEKKPYDASKYTGIRFHAKGNVPVRVGILVWDVVENTYGGGCTPPAEPTLLEDCGDSHGKQISLTGDWKEYRIPFEGLRQGDWGLPADFNPASITSIHFDIEKDVTFDVGIDQLGFYE